jgi:hypothetical protein
LGWFLRIDRRDCGHLIGLIFVVITLGGDHAKEGGTDRIRLFVTPILVYFASLLIIALAMMPPLSEPIRALALGVIGCAGLFYVTNLAFLLRRLLSPNERELLWDILLPIAGYRSSSSRPLRGRLGLLLRISSWQPRS